MKTHNLARYSMLAIILWATGVLIIVQMFRVQTSANAQALLAKDKHFEVIIRPSTHPEAASMTVGVTH